MSSRVVQYHPRPYIAHVWPHCKPPAAVVGLDALDPHNRGILLLVGKAPTPTYPYPHVVLRRRSKVRYILRIEYPFFPPMLVWIDRFCCSCSVCFKKGRWVPVRDWQLLLVRVKKNTGTHLVTYCSSLTLGSFQVNEGGTTTVVVLALVTAFCALTTSAFLTGFLTTLRHFPPCRRYSPTRYS